MSATRARSEIARRSLSISDTGYVVTKQLIFDLGFPEWSIQNGARPFRNSTNSAALFGVSSLGLMTIELPQIRAGPSLRAMRRTGSSMAGCRRRRRSADGRTNCLAGPVAFENLAFNSARPLGHVVEIVHGERRLDLGQREDLALLFGNHMGDLSEHNGRVRAAEQ